MTPSCKEIQDLILARHDGEPLSESERDALRVHLGECPACQEFERDVARILGEMAHDPLPSLSDAFFREFREKILEAVPETVPAWKRFLENLRLPGITKRQILVPALSGLFGLLLGISLTLTWTQGTRVTPRSPLAVRQPISVSEASTPSGTPALLSFVEDYVGDDMDLIDSLDEQDMETLVAQWAGDIPEPLLENGDSGDGAG